MMTGRAINKYADYIHKLGTEIKKQEGAIRWKTRLQFAVATIALSVYIRAHFLRDIHPEARRTFSPAVNSSPKLHILLQMNSKTYLKL